MDKTQNKETGTVHKILHLTKPEETRCAEHEKKTHVPITFTFGKREEHYFKTKNHRIGLSWAEWGSFNSSRPLETTVEPSKKREGSILKNERGK